MDNSGQAALDSSTDPVQRFIARFEGGGPAFSARGDQPLLLSAEQSGLQVPSACRNGTCRTCMCQLRSGRVRYRIQWPGLSREEKAEGWILPCIAHPLTDVLISWPRNFLPAGSVNRYPP